MASPHLPEGTVTFLFTDIEGSTRLVAEVGDTAYGAILDTERRLVVDAAVAEGGVPFGSEGDAHFVAFGSAVAAIRAAVAAQRALAGHAWAAGPVRVRMGIHSGEVQVAGDDYLGLEVHRVARIAAAGHGGQVLVSDVTRALAGDPGVPSRCAIWASTGSRTWPARSVCSRWRHRASRRCSRPCGRSTPRPTTCRRS
ncbi:MAG: hypothetical protein A2V85_18000 [Chloroflexi bacterium RBG_16_72_14]|nr:MAG: hypothetical protein A2V85_18000 [Chloroflexi bacterium RBG_16_72_14]